MLRKVFWILVAALAALAAAACGQKGPLYVTGVPKNAPWPYPAPKAKAPAPAGAPAVPDVPATSDDRQ
jgi:predicted small lipoprotein YifL